MQIVQSTQAITQATGSTAGVALAANAARVYCEIQNVGANPIYLLYGIGSASATNFSRILQAGSAALDGKGGLYQSGQVVYNGAISVGGTAPTYVAVELAP